MSYLIFLSSFVVFNVGVLSFVKFILSIFSSTLLRYNLHIMNCTHFYYIVQCILINYFMFIGIMVNSIGFNFVFQCLLLACGNTVVFTFGCDVFCFKFFDS